MKGDLNKKVYSQLWFSYNPWDYFQFRNTKIEIF